MKIYAAILFFCYSSGFLFGDEEAAKEKQLFSISFILYLYEMMNVH